jgi:multisubunit Na+/H+ antiporter MnhG subunit
VTRHLAALACTWAGVGVIVLACLAAAVAADALPRLHFATVLTSVGTPLAGLGLCLELGVGLPAASVLLAVVLVAVAGPAMSGAVGRVVAQREGQLPAEEPR